MKIIKFVLLSIIFTSLTSCSISKNNRLEQNSEGCSKKSLTRLYFGSATPKGQVSVLQWQLFVKKEITPLFPKGLTILQGKGQWLGSNKKIVSETSRIVEILHDNSSIDVSSIAKIVAKYKTKFKQEAVMELHDQVNACFS